VRAINYFFLFSLVIVGCSEGGTGGTGGISSGDDLITTSGSGNKGPYSDTAAVTSRTIMDNGTLASEVVSGVMTTGIFGGYEVTTDRDTTQLVQINGSYFSENIGTTQDVSVSLRGVILAGQTSANINVATHLIHERVIDLIGDGMSASTAIASAEDELVLALSSLIPSPANAINFSDLVLINAQPGSVNPEGNAWLLALSSILEKSALILNDSSGLGIEAEVTNVLASLTTDLESDGTLADQALNGIQEARSQINPDRIHQNLLFLDETLREDVLLDSGNATADQLDEFACGVFQDDVVCADLGVIASDAVGDVLSSPIIEAGVEVIIQPLTDSIADMNLFIDTDSDGTVNSLDDDDDGDGIPDATDATPYDPNTAGEPTALLLPPQSEAEFTDYLKHGLEQWSGLSADSARLETALGAGLPFAVDTQFDALDGVLAEAVDVVVAAPPSGTDFSEINILVKGVDEIDVAKFNGTHLYLANNDRIQIMETSIDGSAANLVKTLKVTDTPGDFANTNGLYLYETSGQSVLAGIRNHYVYSAMMELDALFAPWGWNGTTVIDLFDVNDPLTAAKTEELRLDGSYVDSRRIGKTLYVITRFSPTVDGLIPFAESDVEKETNRAFIAALDVNDMLPGVTDSNGNVKPLVSTDGCFVPEASVDSTEGQIYYPTITTITAIDLLNPGSYESICMTDGIYGIHVSQDSIYLAAIEHTFNRFHQYFTETIVHKFSIGDGLTGYVGSGKVAGTFWGDAKFLMAEHEGNLTLVTTINTPNEVPSFKHRLTILGESDEAFQLEELSHLPNDTNTDAIGKPNEQIFASRIVGDRAFLVTFEQVDPVYIIDLSDTSNPVIAGELEIPGFSTYLHPLSDDLLLGIGKDSITYEGFPYFQGLNMRLFDISDAANIQVKSEFKIGKRGTESPVFWDSHAFTILPASADTPHRIAIPISTASLPQDGSSLEPWQYGNWSEDALYLFEIDESAEDVSIENVGKLVSQDLSTGQVWQPACCSWNDRSFTNGEVVHYLNGSRLYSAGWASNTSEALFIPTMFKDDTASACTAEVREGLRVYVSDWETGQHLTCPVITAVEGEFTQDLHTNCSSASGLNEREGSYLLSVDMDGYLPWQRSDVRVQADECHVGLTWLNVYLQRE
jgi:uncharacterized secreted protein with C-terminal beta-propeller domain